MPSAGCDYFVRCGWTHRKESLEECTDKSWEFLKEYLAIVPYPMVPFYAYKFKGKQDNLDRDFVYQALKKGVNRQDMPPRPVIPELGYSLSLHTKQPNSNDIRIHCGCYGEYTWNSVMIAFPFENEETRLFYQKEFLRKTFELVIHIWNPHYGVIMNSALGDATDQYDNKIIQVDDISELDDDDDQLDDEKIELHVGWLTYLSSIYGELPKLPDWADVTKIEGRGTIISATEHLANSQNQDDVLKVSELLAILDPFYKKVKNRERSED